MYSAEMSRPLPLTAFCMYVVEKHNQEIYKEDCMWLMASPNIEESKRKSLKQPYARVLDSESHQRVKSDHKTIDEALDYIFDGI